MITRRELSLLLLAAPAFGAAKKKYKHPLGFRLELPDGWTTENATVGVTLSPPGTQISNEREDNPEVYTVWSCQDDGSSEQDYIAGLRARFKNAKIAVDRSGDVEQFAIPRKNGGISGMIYTFDFVHPERKAPYRIRAFAMQVRGRTLILIGQGQRDKIVARDKTMREIASSIDW